MKGFDIEKEKQEIIKWVTTLKDETSIERLRMLRKTGGKADWWDEISDAERIAIDRGLKDIKEKKVRPHRDVKKLYEKWL
jgi:hypothetical protein